MKAVVLHAARDLRIDELPEPAPGGDQVLIEINACGVCPSDIRWYTGAKVPDEYPRRLGHEWAGEVLEVGADVTGFKAGDRVVPDWRVICGDCYYCRNGAANFCAERRAGIVVGGFAQRGIAIPANLRRVPDGVSDEEACFAEPLACCIHGSYRSGIAPGSDVVVIGVGPIGLIHTQLAKHQGARVIVCDRLPNRLEKARELGADVTIQIDEVDPVKRVLELTDGRGANTVIVAIGSPQAADTAIRLSAKNATINLFGGFYPSGKLELDLNLIHYRQINLTGSHDFTPEDFTRAVEFIASGVVKLEPLITYRLPLEKILDGFDAVVKHDGLKVVIKTQE